jgi:hypothetical protein
LDGRRHPGERTATHRFHHDHPDVARRRVPHAFQPRLKTLVKEVKLQLAEVPVVAIDDLFEKGARLINPIERAKIYHQIQKILVTDLPGVWIEEYGKNSAWRSEFKGLHAWSSLSSYTLEDVWWTKGKSK